MPVQLKDTTKFLDLQPPVDPPPEGREYRITGYTETATDIRPIFKLVPVVSPPRTFSKLRLVTALTERNLWPAVRDWLEETGYYDLFVAQHLAVPTGARFTRGSPPKRSFSGTFPPNLTLLLFYPRHKLYHRRTFSERGNGYYLPTGG